MNEVFGSVLAGVLAISLSVGPFVFRDELRVMLGG